MQRLACCLILLLAFAHTDAYSQRKSKPRPQTKPPATKQNIDDLPFASPIEVRIGLHRQSDPALFLTLRNEGQNLSIESINALVVVIDALKMRVIRTYPQGFDFAVPVGPQSTGEAVATKSDGFWLSMNDLILSACRKYQPAKEDPAFFTPSTCISSGDTLTVRIISISYTDGSHWIAPKSREVNLSNYTGPVRGRKP